MKAWQLRCGGPGIPQMINFEYDLDEIVQVDGIGLVTLRKALAHMPEKVGPLGVLYRGQGKIPALFDAGQIPSAPGSAQG
jgi:hypothetical protein